MLISVLALVVSTLSLAYCARVCLRAERALRNLRSELAYGYVVMGISATARGDLQMAAEYEQRAARCRTLAAR